MIGTPQARVALSFSGMRSTWEEMPSLRDIETTWMLFVCIHREKCGYRSKAWICYNEARNSLEFFWIFFIITIHALSESTHHILKKCSMPIKEGDPRTARNPLSHIENSKARYSWYSSFNLFLHWNLQPPPTLNMGASLFVLKIILSPSWSIYWNATVLLPYPVNLCQFYRIPAIPYSQLPYLVLGLQRRHNRHRIDRTRNLQISISFYP